MNGIILFNPKSAVAKHRIPNAIMNIAASVNGTFPWVIVDGNREEDPYQKIKDYLDTGSFKYLGFTVMPGPQTKQAIPFSKKIKEDYPQTVMIWGGYFPTSHFKVALNSGYVDFVINGPGDHAFPRLIHALENNEPYELIKNLIYRFEDKVIKTIIAETGVLNIVINNAGIAHIGNIEQVEPIDVDVLIGVNVKGIYHIIQACIPFLKKQGGVILNMASVASLVGLADRFAYSMTKGAVNGITLSIARDYLSYNIRCNSISPARVHTPFVDGFLAKNYPGQEEEMFRKLETSQPIGRMAKPEEIAYLALYLCSDEASFITGCDYPIDGGFVKLNN